MAKSRKIAEKLDTLRAWKDANGIPKPVKLENPSEVFNPNIKMNRYKEF